MFIQTLITLFMGEVVQELLMQHVNDTILHKWNSYLQGSLDLQTALRDACVKTAGMIAVGLAPESWATRYLKLTSPKLSREFTTMMDSRYIKPYCNNNEELEQTLREHGKTCCRDLTAFFKIFPFKHVASEEVATFLYNVGFMGSLDVVHEQERITKSSLRAALIDAKITPYFVDFLLFPDSGGGILYDGIIYYFEEAIKSNERVNAMLAHFDRQQILKETHQQHDEIHEKLTTLQQQISLCTNNGDFKRIGELAQQANACKEQEQGIREVLNQLEENADVWQSVNAELVRIRHQFDNIKDEITGHFDQLQQWLNTELVDVKDEIKNHVSSEASEIMRFVRQELSTFLGHRETISIQSTDFLSKPYVLWERYEKLNSLGKGGVAQVWKVRKGALGIAALKVLHPKFEHDPAVVARFFAEGKIMGILGDAPGRYFAKVREMGQSLDGEYFLETDFISGQTLHHHLKNRGKFSVDEALHILRQVATALKYAHECHIIHRDIKPQNILLDHEKHITLIDFGIAKRLEHDSILASNSFYGTLQYAAPEQFDRKRFGKISERTDAYSFGVLGYYLLLGKFPFVAETQAEYIHAHCYENFPDIPNEIPEVVTTLLTRCTQKSQKDRFENMQTIEKYIDDIFTQNAINEYRELFTPFAILPELSTGQRAALERHRLHLKLTQDIVEQIEHELSGKYRPSQEGSNILSSDATVKVKDVESQDLHSTESEFLGNIEKLAPLQEPLSKAKNITDDHSKQSQSKKGKLFSKKKLFRMGLAIFVSLFIILLGAFVVSERMNTNLPQGRIVYVQRSPDAPLYAKPDTTSQIITYLMKNQGLEILSQQGEWYQVKALLNGEVGWVLEAWFKTSL